MFWFPTSNSPGTVIHTRQTARLGAGGSILNGDNCTVDTAGAAADTNGNQLTLSLPVTFLNPPPGADTMPVYVRAANNENVDSGYQQAGTFTLYPGASPNFMMSVTPAFRDVAVGSNATYTVTVVPKPGFNDVVTLSASAGVSAAAATLAPASVTGGGVSTLTVTTSDIPENSSQPYTGGGYPVIVTGESPSGTFFQYVDLLVETHAPSIEVNDRPISGTTHVYAVSVNDVLAYTNWATGITGVNLLIAPSLNGQHACWVFYDGSILWLANDDASVWTPVGPLGTTKTAQNSQCTVGGPAGSPGPRLFPHVGWNVSVPVTFSPGFATGANLLWLRAGNAAGFDSGYFPWLH